MQENGPRNLGFFGTRNMGFMHQNLIEVLSYAMVLTVSLRGALVTDHWCFGCNHCFVQNPTEQIHQYQGGSIFQTWHILSSVICWLDWQIYFCLKILAAREGGREG